MKHLMLALCALSLAACGGDSTNTDTDNSAGGLDGMPLAQLEELGLECEGGMYPDLRKVEGDLCVLNIPELAPIVDDCRMIAEAGCTPVAAGCGYMAVLDLFLLEATFEAGIDGGDEIKAKIPELTEFTAIDVRTEFFRGGQRPDGHPTLVTDCVNCSSGLLNDEEAACARGEPLSACGLYIYSNRASAGLDGESLSCGEI